MSMNQLYVILLQIGQDMVKHGEDESYTSVAIIGALCAVITAMALYIVKQQGEQKKLIHECVQALNNNSSSNRDLKEGIKELRQALTQFMINGGGLL